MNQPPASPPTNPAAQPGQGSQPQTSPTTTGQPHGPTPQVLHDRASQSARETRQAIITLSAASLGFFFIALTSKVEPPLTPLQRRTVIVALVAMALATFSGLWSAWADARWSYCWAREIEQHPPGSLHWDGRRDWWHGNKRWSEWASILCFGIGVLAAAIYTFLRTSV